MKEQKKLTLYNLKKWVDDWLHNCELNHKDSSEVEVIIKDSTDNHEYRPFGGYLSVGNEGVKVGIEFFHSDIIKFDPKAERPIAGEYWKSRGASTFNVSGFITSKAAGLRLLRMVRYILDTDEPETWLDYREYEPNYIQFKFSSKEFDIEKLDEVSRANGGVVTEEMLRDCMKHIIRED